MATHTVTFERIGRNKTVPPLTIDTRNPIDIAMAISDYAKPYIRSADYDVGVDDDLSGGHIIAGMHEVSKFKISTT